MSEEPFLGWDDVLRLLKERKVRVGKRAVEQYLKLGLVSPKPQAKGRPGGKGQGVDWGWPASDAVGVVADVLDIQRRLDRHETLAGIAEEQRREMLEASEQALREELRDEVWQEAYDAGYEAALDDMRAEQAKAEALDEYADLEAHQIREAGTEA